jgi:hypothetical protein
MTILERIGAPKDKQRRRDWCAAYIAALMEARGYIIQVRTADFKHEALDNLDRMLCEQMDKVIEQNAEMKQPADNPMEYNPEPGWRS